MIRIQLIVIAKPHAEFNTQKRIEAEKIGGKDGKTWHKLSNSAVFGKTIENWRNKIVVKLVSNKKRPFKMDIQTKPHATQKKWQWFSCDT